MGTEHSKQPWWASVQRAIVGAWAFLKGGIWSLDLTRRPSVQAMGIRQLKLLIFLYRQFYADMLLTRASALTYSSLLAIVPFFAVVFAISKGFGLHMNLAPVLSNLFSSLGPRGDQIATKILEFVENSQTGALGAVGFVALLLTVFGIVSRIEASYNEIWHVPRGRAWSRRGVGYMVLIVIGPLFALLILSATASVASTGLVQKILSYRISAALVQVGLRLTPYVLSCLLFTLMIWLVPNIHVKWRAAITGGCLSGILWQLSNWGLARFVVGASHASTRDVLFAGFAALPLFLLWLYLGWVITLLGAELGYVVQHIGVMEWRELEKRYGEEIRRFVRVRTALEIVRHFVTGPAVPSLEELEREMRMPGPIIRESLEPLVTANLLARSADDTERYLPVRDPAIVTVAELFRVFRGPTPLPESVYAKDPFGRYVEQLLRQMDASLERGPGKRSLHEAALSAGKTWPTRQAMAEETVTPAETQSVKTPSADG